MKKYKSEFHVHTRFSKDSIMPLWLIALICKIKKIDTIAITDHNEIKGAIKLKKILKNSNIEVIIGEEIFTKDGEIIGLNLKELIEPNLSAKETIKRIKKQHGIVYVPHPYDEKRYKTVLKEKEISINKKEIDFIESHNGRNIKKYFSEKQNQLADEYKIKKIIGSDAHTFIELGRNYILTDKKIKANSIMDDYDNPIFNKKECIQISHKLTKIARLIKIVTRGDFNELHRIINRRCKKKK